MLNRPIHINKHCYVFFLNYLRRNVTIHVCDETRDAKKDFVCRQDLLLNQMGYFRDITTGQSLEDVDISVHCDITIFEWLMAWIKNQDERNSISSLEEDNMGHGKIITAICSRILFSVSTVYLKYITFLRPVDQVDDQVNNNKH